MTIFIVITLHEMKALSLNFQVVREQFPQILGWKVWEVAWNLGLRESPQAQIKWKTLCFCAVFICLCVYYLNIVYLCFWFLFTLRGLFVGSSINYVVYRCWVRDWLLLWSSVAVLVGYLWLIFFSCRFYAGFNEMLAFFSNLLLLLFIPF